MKITPRIYAISLYQMIKELPASEHKLVIKNFLKYLLKNKDFKLIDKITAEFDKYLEEVSEVQKIQVDSAYPLTEKNRVAIKDLVKKTLNVKQVKLMENVKSDLVGGVVVRWGDQVIDTSVKNRLWQLKKYLIGI